jgi:transcriptional regulator with XRE-family HTH domain
LDKEGLFAYNFKKYRKKRGISQKQFAQKLFEATGKKLTLTSISNYETGLHMPPPQILPAIASILQVSIDALFGKKEIIPAISEDLDQNLIKEWKEELEKIEKEYVSWKVRQKERPMPQLIACCDKLLRLAKNQQEELLVMQTELITIKDLITLFRK